MEDLTWADLVGAIGSIITPVLLLIGGLVVWKYRQSLERKMRLEQDLRSDRVDLYYQILEPFVLFLTSDAAWKKDPKHKNKDKNKLAELKMVSLDYRTASLKLRLIAGDDVLRAYDSLMKHFSTQPPDMTKAMQLERVKNTIDLLGGFFLAIRKSMGNEATELTRMEMVEWIFSYDDVTTL